MASTSTAATATRRAAALAPRLKALADPHRLAIVFLLAEEAMTVKGLQDATGLGQTLVSHHLRTLREQGLVRVEAHGRSNVYELCCEALEEPLQAIGRLAG